MMATWQPTVCNWCLLAFLLAPAWERSWRSRLSSLKPLFSSLLSDFWRWSPRHCWEFQFSAGRGCSSFWIPDGPDEPPIGVGSRQNPKNSSATCRTKGTVGPVAHHAPFDPHSDHHHWHQFCYVPCLREAFPFLFLPQGNMAFFHLLHQHSGQILNVKAPVGTNCPPAAPCTHEDGAHVDVLILWLCSRQGHLHTTSSVTPFCSLHTCAWMFFMMMSPLPMHLFSTLADHVCIVN